MAHAKPHSHTLEGLHRSQRRTRLIYGISLIILSIVVIYLHTLSQGKQFFHPSPATSSAVGAGPHMTPPIR